jgi:2-polyprenyl-3-methyl-5-hydroxy-6-metoxy-1,4-benzoquinol methylase
LNRYTVAQAARHFCSETRNAERNRRLLECIRRLWQQDYVEILQCRHCGFGFGDPFVAGDEEFYSILHEAAGYPSWRWEYEFALKQSRGLAASKAPASLDIGAGHGRFLEGLGKRWICHGVEGSPATRKILAEKGIRVVDSLADIPAGRGSSFQLITMFQVLEHVTDFRQTLKICRDLIDPSGALIISVPDGAAMFEQEVATGCPDMPPNHIGRWSVTSLSRVLGEEGFTVSQIKMEPVTWKIYLSKLHLKILSDSTNPRSLAAQIYRIRKKQLRVMLLPFAALTAGIKLIRRWRYFTLSGSFLVLAHPRPPFERVSLGA